MVCELISGDRKCARILRVTAALKNPNFQRKREPGRAKPQEKTDETFHPNWPSLRFAPSLLCEEGRASKAKSRSSLPRISAGNPPYTGYTGPLCRFINPNL